MTDDPYASHLPILRAMVASLRPKKVLEFGAGLHSTPFFLQDPELTRIVSVEADNDWRRRIAFRCDDQRLVLRVDRRVAPEYFDLVLIDDGTCAAERLETIHFVLAGPHPPVIIHDAEVPEYATIIKELAINYSIFPTAPDTAVVWA